MLEYIFLMKQELMLSALIFLLLIIYLASNNLVTEKVFNRDQWFTNCKFTAWLLGKPYREFIWQYVPYRWVDCFSKKPVEFCLAGNFFYGL